jgi:transcriptional regulator with XRE-family HTH domain
MIGARIREARLAQRLSLSDVAQKANISTATLSRIETEKQTLAFDLFLTLSNILRLPPQELVAADDSDGVEPLVNRIRSLEAGERAKVWRELTEARRAERPAKARRGDAEVLTQQVEELVAQIELLREELNEVRSKIRRKR